MTTECNPESLAFQSLGNREVIARFDGGKITSDAGALLLREVERRTDILQRFAACFTDHRDPERIEHTVEELIAQRVFALCRIKEQQLCLFADRTSCATLRANELRLWFSSMAYGVMTALRRLGLQETELAAARCDTIRLKLFKIGALIRVTVRKVWVTLAESYPYPELFRKVYHHLVGVAGSPMPVASG